MYFLKKFLRKCKSQEKECKSSVIYFLEVLLKCGLVYQVYTINGSQLDQMVLMQVLECIFSKPNKTAITTSKLIYGKVWVKCLILQTLMSDVLKYFKDLFIPFVKVFGLKIISLKKKSSPKKKLSLKKKSLLKK